MSASNARLLYYMPKPSRWDKGVGAALPEAYKKFWKEWKQQEPTAVHYIKEEGWFKRNEKTGEVVPVQNVPIPLKYPKEFHEGLWGGEAVVQGFKQRLKYQRRYPHFWFPEIKKSIIYSEVLDAYMRVVVTERTINLIHENYGFDHYLLKTPACDLKSELALKIKRNILIALADKTLYPDDEVKREKIYNKYSQYLSAYTREEIEWYGLSYKDAVKKFIKEQEEQNKPRPLKLKYRSELIEELKRQNIAEAKEKGEKTATLSSQEGTWISKWNPFSKTPETK